MDETLRAALTGGISLMAIIGLASCSDTDEPEVDHGREIAELTQGSSCADLEGLALTDTVILSSQMIEAGTFEIPVTPGSRPVDASGLPEFCRVSGSIRPTVESDI